MSENSDVPSMIDLMVRDAARYPKIPPDQREAYVQRAKTGDTLARDTLYANYLPAVIALARSKYNQVKELPSVHVELEDLVQEGVRGIFAAIEQYRSDNDGDAGFTTYVFKRIGYCINNSITDHGRLVRLSKVRITQIRFIYAATTALEAQLGRTPTSDEVARYLNFRFSAAEIDDIKDTMENSYAISIHSASHDTEDGTLEDTLADPDDFTEEVLQQELLKDLHKYFNTLSANEQLVLTYLFGLKGESKTLTEISTMLYNRGITGYGGTPLTKEAVRRISQRAIRKLHMKLRSYANDFNY